MLAHMWHTMYCMLAHNALPVLQYTSTVKGSPVRASELLSAAAQCSYKRREGHSHCTAAPPVALARATGQLTASLYTCSGTLGWPPHGVHCSASKTALQFSTLILTLAALYRWEWRQPSSGAASGHGLHMLLSPLDWFDAHLALLGLLPAVLTLTALAFGAFEAAVVDCSC